MYKTMHNLKNRSNDKKGFTLAELLIVVAIIAVMVAIAIPIFTTQLEKAREATDIANIRAAYAEACLDALENGTGEGTATTVAMVSDAKFTEVTGVVIGKSAIPADFSVTTGNTVKVDVAANGDVTLTAN